MLKILNTDDTDIQARDDLIQIALKKKNINLRASHKSPRYSSQKRKQKKKGRKRKRDNSKAEKDADEDTSESEVEQQPPKKRQKGTHIWWQKPEIQQYYKEIQELGYNPPKNPYIVTKRSETSGSDSDEDIDMRDKGMFVQSFLIFNT